MQTGIFSLTKNDGAEDLAIGAAATVICEVIDGLDGMSEADVQVNFQYGPSGGTTCKTYIQTSLDQGSSWIDLYCMAAATVSKKRHVRLKPDGTIGTASDGALADDSLATGLVLGDRLRVKAIVAGTYVGAELSVRVAVR